MGAVVNKRIRRGRGTTEASSLLRSRLRLSSSSSWHHAIGRAGGSSSTLLACLIVFSSVFVILAPVVESAAVSTYRCTDRAYSPSYIHRLQIWKRKMSWRVLRRHWCRYIRLVLAFCKSPVNTKTGNKPCSEESIMIVRTFCNVFFSCFQLYNLLYFWMEFEGILRVASLQTAKTRWDTAHFHRRSCRMDEFCSQIES